MSEVIRSKRALDHAGFIWSVADLFRGGYKRSDYGKVILPLTVLRRLDCVLAPTKAKVLEKDAELEGRLKDKAPLLNRITGVQFHNASPLDIAKVLDDPPNAAEGLRRYVAGFSQEARDVFEKFGLDAQITRLDQANLLYLVLGRFAEIDLGPEAVSNAGGHGQRLRGARQALQRALQRDRRRALHPA